MVGNKSKGTITFSYSSEELLNHAGIISSYMAKSIGNDGELLDRYSVSKDEEEIFKVCVKQSLSSIYEVVIKLTSKVENALQDSVEVKADETTGLKRKAGTYVEITVKDNGAYNANTLNIMDKILRDCIVYGSLTSFYSVNMNADLFRISQANLDSSMSSLKKTLFHLGKKKTYSLM